MMFNSRKQGTGVKYSFHFPSSVCEATLAEIAVTQILLNTLTTSELLLAPSLLESKLTRDRSPFSSLPFVCSFLVIQ